MPLSDLASALAAATGPSRELDERLADEWRKHLREAHAAADTAAEGRGYKLHPRIAATRFAAARLAEREAGER